jgi:hypothetical protein
MLTEWNMVRIQMPGVQELRARIDKLSAEIELQKELLKKLEHDKSLVQRQLNAALDPVARLPLEISSEIFLQSLPTYPKPSPRVVPMLLLNICNAWTSIALSTPALWASIQIVFMQAEGFEEGLQAWFHRACNRPLSIALDGKCDKGVAIFWRHRQRLEDLEIFYENDDSAEEDEDEDDERPTIDLVGDASPGPLPLLKTLTIRGLTDVGDGWGVRGSQVLELLRFAPNLVECIFDNMRPVYGVEDITEELVLPALRRLRFGDRGSLSDSDDDLLKCLSLPALESLALSLRDISSSDLFSFVMRSAPPLQELILGSQSFRLDFTRLHGCFHLIPTLQYFQIYQPELYIMTKLFSALADSPSLLPNLHTLMALHLHLSDIPDSFWPTLLRALSARRTQLQRVFIMLLNVPRAPWEPAAADRAAFEELMAGGMHIYVGPSNRNYLMPHV